MVGPTRPPEFPVVAKRSPHRRANGIDYPRNSAKPTSTRNKMLVPRHMKGPDCWLSDWGPVVPPALAALTFKQEERNSDGPQRGANPQW